MFADALTFLRNEDLPATTAGKLVDVIADLPSLRKLKIELAVRLMQWSLL